MSDPSTAPDAPNVATAVFPDLETGAAPLAQAVSVDRLADVSLDVAIEIGRTRIQVRDLLQLGRGSVVELDRGPNAPVDVLVNGTLFARGEIVVVGDDLGVRVQEIVG